MRYAGPKLSTCRESRAAEPYPCLNPSSRLSAVSAYITRTHTSQAIHGMNSLFGLASRAPGLMFGKALYEGILLPVPFAHFFVARLQVRGRGCGFSAWVRALSGGRALPRAHRHHMKLLVCACNSRSMRQDQLRPLPSLQGRQPLFDDLATLDPELHKNLLMVGGCRTCLSVLLQYCGTPDQGFRALAHRCHRLLHRRVPVGTLFNSLLPPQVMVDPITPLHRCPPPQVKRYEGDVSDLCLAFSAETDVFGCPVRHELLPGRGDTPVT